MLGVITVQSPYGGSPIASDLTANETLRGVTTRALETLLRAPRGEGARTLLPPLLDVTYENRMSFLEHHPLPDRFPCVSFHTRTSSNNSVLALVAAYARNTYGEENDVLVCRVDAEVPGQPPFDGAEFDHADGAYPRRSDAVRSAPSACFSKRKRNALPASRLESHAETPKAARLRKTAREEARRRRRADSARAGRGVERDGPPGGARALRTRTRRSVARRVAHAPRGRRRRAFSDLPGFSGNRGCPHRLARRPEGSRRRTRRRRRDDSARRQTTTTTSGRRGETRMRTRRRRRPEQEALVRAYPALNAAVPERLPRPRTRGRSTSARVAADGARRKQKRGDGGPATGLQTRNLSKSRR